LHPQDKVYSHSTLKKLKQSSKHACLVLFSSFGAIGAELRRGVHPHQVIVTSSSKCGLCHNKKPERVRGNVSTQPPGLCHGKKSEQAGCIASTQPNSNEMCITFQMMVNKHKHLIKNKTGSIFQLIVGFKAKC
jgi:hypothetical protein